MTFYEYRCTACNTRYIREVRPGQPGWVPCPKCGSEEVARSPVSLCDAVGKKSVSCGGSCGAFG